MAKAMRHCNKYRGGLGQPAQNCDKFRRDGLKACLDCVWYAGLKPEQKKE